MLWASVILNIVPKVTEWWSEKQRYAGAEESAVDSPSATRQQDPPEGI